MNEPILDGYYTDLQAKLNIDCNHCSGLCCVALYCIKTDGFPANKEAGVPCSHLMPDFRCDMHAKLLSKKMRGCLAYDCFGAGQKVTQYYDSNTNWKSTPDKANEIFQTFSTVTQLHQMEWYLIESLSLTLLEPLKTDIKELISENEQMTAQPPEEIMNLDITNYRQKVNEVLKDVCKGISTHASDGGNAKDCFGKDFKRANLEGSDFSMSLLIAANLEGCNLRDVNFLGADMRDANLKNTDLRNCAFLTQMQINSAKGNGNTKLPQYLSRPTSWGE